MSSLRPGRRTSSPSPADVTVHRCRSCRESLSLVRRHTSPARLGAPLTTEYYRCNRCDSGFVLTPATGKWKPWAIDD